MVGKGVLLECLDHPEVESVLVINRSSLGIEHEKLKEIVHNDFNDFSSIQDQLAGYNACFFCLGVSAVGMSEEKYRKITYDLTLQFAELLSSLNPDMIFNYVSGAGTDSSESGRQMWARVKGKTENDLLNLPFKKVYLFRPGVIIPRKNIKSKTTLYNIAYFVLKPILPIWKWLAPGSITTTTQVGQAMINSVLHRVDKIHLENRDINQLAIQE